METINKIEQALSLKEEVEQFASLMLHLRDSRHDNASQRDRVRIKSVSLPELDGREISGAARFRKSGEVRALGIRQSEPGSSGSVEITLRTLRSKTAIIKKTIDPNRRNYARIATAVFRSDGGVIRYHEETRPMRTSA